MDVIIPDFSNYKYPLIMKILYHEIMFSMIDGVTYARLFDSKRRVSYPAL
jgi:hypothetical protein